MIAPGGGAGSSALCTGKVGKDEIIEVPLGTVAKDAETGDFLFEITEHGEEIILLSGGKGGLGNNHFKSSTNQTPRYAQPGEPGKEEWKILELKVFADVGLVGFPNAGKSTLLAATSNARSNIADYPFTTLHPNLGVVGVDNKEFVIADIPGLIAGASDGVGLGVRFLGHVERCAVLLHLVDGTSETVVEDYITIIQELEKYGGDLANRPRVTALNKIDAIDETELAIKVHELELHIGSPILQLSGVSRAGLTDVLRAVASEVEKRDAIEKNNKVQSSDEEPSGWRP